MIALIIILAGFVFVTEYSSRSIYGPFLTNEDVSQYIDKYDYFESNPFSTTLISGVIENGTTEDLINSLKDRSFISVTEISIFTKYYINGKGRVLRFSRASKQIDNLYKNLKQ